MTPLSSLNATITKTVLIIYTGYNTVDAVIHIEKQEERWIINLPQRSDFRKKQCLLRRERVV